MNSKKKGYIILIISLLFFFTSLVFFIIGINKGSLINGILKYIFLVLLIISLVFIIYSLYLLIRHKKRRFFKKGRVIVISILTTCFGIASITLLFLLYGPNASFRNWLVTTAMRTMHHHYFAEWFYSDEAINEVMNNNYVDDDGLATDASLVDHRATTTYANDYEREILEHAEGQAYKVIRFTVNGCNAYLGVVYDPSMVSVGTSKWLGSSGQYIYDMAKEQNALIAINGGGFIDPQYKSNGALPQGVSLSNGKIISNRSIIGTGLGLVGFNKDNTLVLMKNVTGEEALEQGIRDAVTRGPFLIVNGKQVIIRGDGGWGYAARSAIGQRKDGIVLLLVVDSNATRTNGASMVDLAEIMARYGAFNAANLDGGTSSAFVELGELISDPIDSAFRHRTRPIPTMWKVTLN